MVDSDPSIKRTICKRCDTTLIPALTSTVRMKGMKWCKCMHVFTWLTSRLTRPCIHYPLQDMWHRQEVVSRLPSAFFTTIRKHCRKRKQRSNVIKQSCAANQIRLFALFLSFSFPFSCWTTMMNAYNEADWGVSTDGDVFSPSFDHRDSLGQFNPFQDYEVGNEQVG